LRGLGAATLKALRDLSAGAHWALAGARGEYAAGAGPAMRITPLAFVLDPLQEDDLVILRDVARITHHSDEAYAGALAVTLAVRMCAQVRHVPDDFLRTIVNGLPDSRVRDRLIAFTTTNASLEELASQFGVSGYVAEAVPMALLSAARAGSRPLELVLEQVVALGGDTDTIASITGQILGASGVEVPAGLLARIPGVLDVERVVSEFISAL
jgi:ADP-ribosylglycohydrolase